MTSSNGNIFRVTGLLCGNSPVTAVNSPHKGQWRGALMSSLICTWTDSWANNGDAGDLRRYRAHCDVIVMKYFLLELHWPHNWNPHPVTQGPATIHYVDAGEKEISPLEIKVDTYCVQSQLCFLDGFPENCRQLILPVVIYYIPMGPLIRTWVDFNPNMDK